MRSVRGIRRAGKVAAWLVILPVMGVAGELGEPAVPSPHMLIPLVLGLLIALTGLVRHHPPAVLNRGSQVLLGVLMGSYLDLPALSHVAGSIAPLAVVTLATLLLCQVAAFAMVRFSGMDRATATLGMIAGGSAAAVASAEDLKADGRMVAFMQYLRLGVVTAIGLAPGFAPSGILRTLLFTMIGLDVGLRFSRRTMGHLRRILPAALACTLAISAGCGALAWLLSVLTHIPFGDTFLATTPGGINAVLATASATHANLPLISSVQSLRLFEMAFLAPILIRLTTARTVRSGRRGSPSR
ncbi:AbrB family transcriptional regulator [Acrocarpospora sp. B8E8]|uniref:AbrB family transcriptional regulator n=1 Tax=Acrocarpospora sp. B8E8 TaxID=3153572 RepID=UPI00325DC11B